MGVQGAFSPTDRLTASPKARFALHAGFDLRPERVWKVDREPVRMNLQDATEHASGNKLWRSRILNPALDLRNEVILDAAHYE